jgi:KaiC/GvpD/RAD55 family RecA-like ATPase
MKIDKLLKKLEPLMPETVRHWRRALDLAEPEMRGLLEKQILLTGHKKLGDFRNRLLLSLPPAKKVKGAISLGTILYEAPKWPAGLTESELLQNVAIFGRSGAGKTNVVFHLLTQLIEKKVPFLFLDWKRTARHLLPAFQQLKIYTPGRSIAPFPFNPFVPPPGLEATAYASHAIDVMGDAYTLGDAARSVLLKAVRTCLQDGMTPTPATVLAAVRAVPDAERVRGWKASAIRALETLALLELVDDNASQATVVAALLKQSTILELDGLSPSNKAFLIPLLCLWVYYVMLPRNDREQLRLVIIVEEAHHLLHRKSGSESLMEMLLRQCREIGISIVVIDQHPHLISSAALGNTYTSICLNLKDPRDITTAATLSLLDDGDKHHLSLLPVGHGIIKLQDRWKQPFLVKFPLVNVPKGFVTDDVLKEHLAGAQTLSAPKASQRCGKNAFTDFRGSDGVLSDDELRFVADITTHEEGGVALRYQRLGISAGKGNQLKQALLAKGVIEEQHIKTGRTHRSLLRITKHARQQLGLGRTTDQGSLAHEYWKRWYAHTLEQQGFRVQLEAPRNKGHVDVLAVKASESVAVEIETGKSDVVENVRQDLLSGFRKVVVVATDERAKNKVETALAQAGLVMPRISIVLRDNGHPQ